MELPVGADHSRAPLRVEGVEIVVIGADIDDATRHSGTAFDHGARRCRPEHGACSGVERVELVVIGADIDDAIRHGGEDWMALPVVAVQSTAPFVASKA